MDEPQETLVILKPEVIENCILGSVLKFFDDFGIRPQKMRMHTPTRNEIEIHYSDILSKVDKDTQEDIIARMTRGNCIFIIYKGLNIIRKVRVMIGPTDPSKADPDTIRGRFGSGIRFNIIHGSDSIENAKKEINLWFPI